MMLCLFSWLSPRQYAVKHSERSIVRRFGGADDYPAAQQAPAKAVQSPLRHHLLRRHSPPSGALEGSSACSAQSVPEQARQGALYRVQVGAFSSRANAERVVNQLKELGYEAIISSGPPYRVQTGAFASRDNAVRLGEELKAKGFEVAVVN